MTDATDHALRALDEFLAQYLGPAALRHVFDHQADEPVRKAIRDIDAEHVRRDAIGYAVFAQRGDADADIGFRLEMVSAVFGDPAQAEVALDYCRAKRQESGVRYLVCKLSDLT